jgi:class I fructose-bisphosphate aldolase
MLSYQDIVGHLWDQSDYLLAHRCATIDATLLTLPGSDVVWTQFIDSDRNPQVLNNLSRLYQHGTLAGTGYLSIFPVDQGIEHSAWASFAKNPLYFDPQNIVELAHQAWCSAVTSTLGVLGLVSRKYAHKIPFVVKLNHNELLTYPNKFDQVMFAQVEQARNMGASGVGATIYFGSAESTRQIQEVSKAFARAHELGMFTILRCYLRNADFKGKDGIDYHTAADLTGQANHLGVTIQADIIKQKLPTSNWWYLYLKQESWDYGKTDPRVYQQLTTDHPIDLTRYQVANCYMGKIPLISSGGASGDNDMQEAIATAVINKRAWWSWLIMGRKVFQKPMEEGIALIQAVQSVYMMPQIDIA